MHKELIDLDIQYLKLQFFKSVKEKSNAVASEGPKGMCFKETNIQCILQDFYP